MHGKDEYVKAHAAEGQRRCEEWRAAVSETKSERKAAAMLTDFSGKWICLICKEKQDTIDRPRTAVCEDCVLPLAKRLCQASLGELNQVGVDRSYWMHEASSFAETLLKRYQSERTISDV